MNLIPRKIFLDDFFNDFLPAEKNIESIKCDIYEKGNKYFIEMDIPGFDKKDISIDYDDNYLTISASSTSKTDEKEKNYIRKERTYGKFERSFYVGNIKEEDIKAEFKAGILTISLPKEEKLETKKRIEIE